MTCTLLNFTVSCWLEMASKISWTVVSYFLPILRIQTSVLFLAVNTWFHGLLFFYWYIYDMLWFSQFFVRIPMGVHIGRKLTLTSNISYFMKGWSERSIFNVGRMEVFLPSISLKPGDYPLPNLLLCSSNF